MPGKKLMTKEKILPSSADNTYMTDREFESLLAEAHAMSELTHRPAYYDGYAKGLERHYRGPHYATLTDHEKWLSLAYDWDEARAEFGRGYRDGLQGIRPLVKGILYR